MYKRILMPIDGSPNSEHTVGWGLDFAKVLGAQVTFLYVLEYFTAALYGIPTGGHYVADLERDMQDAGKELLAQATAQAGALGVVCSSRMLESDHADQTILHEEKQHDLTIMATHSRRGLDRLFLGSVTETVLRRSDKPQLILPGPDENAPDQPHVFGSFGQFLLPIDGSFCNDQAVEEGLRLAKVVGAKVTLLHALEVAAMAHAPDGSVTDQPSIQEGLKRVGQTVLEKTQGRAAALGVEASVRLSDGTWADQAILEAEEAVDLTVMGTHGRRGFDRALIGSITERVLRQSSVPHLIVRCQQV